MSLDVSKIIQHNLDSNFYYPIEVAKSLIVCHHTAGGSDPFIVVDGWKTRTDKVATAFVIGGKPTNANSKWKDGDIIQAFSSKYWANHLGLKTSHFTAFGLPYKQLNDCSIAIEVCNFGYLTKDLQGNFRTYVNSIVPANEVIELDKEYRGYKFWHKYTDAQLLSLRDLLMYLCDKYNIPKDYNANLFEVNKDALSGKSGIFTHTSYRPDKWDMSPQPSLIRILQTLKVNSI
jgi:N-acetyl-anhydromuramyl-L-alanine amidase AmpD